MRLERALGLLLPSGLAIVWGADLEVGNLVEAASAALLLASLPKVERRAIRLVISSAALALFVLGFPQTSPASVGLGSALLVATLGFAAGARSREALAILSPLVAGLVLLAAPSSVLRFEVAADVILFGILSAFAALLAAAFVRTAKSVPEVRP